MLIFFLFHEFGDVKYKIENEYIYILTVRIYFIIFAYFAIRVINDE